MSADTKDAIDWKKGFLGNSASRSPGCSLVRFLYTMSMSNGFLLKNCLFMKEIHWIRGGKTCLWFYLFMHILMSRLVSSIVCKQLPICTANLRVLDTFSLSSRKRGISLCWMVIFSSSWSLNTGATAGWRIALFVLVVSWNIAIPLGLRRGVVGS